METTDSQTETKGPKPTRRFRSIEESLKPILLSLKIIGVYFDPMSTGNKIEDSEMSSPKRKPSGLLALFSNRIYCVIVLLLLWFNVIRYAVGFFPFDEGLPYRVVIIIWFLNGAINTTIMLVSCQRLRHFHSFYKHWDTVFTNPVTQNIGCGFKCTATYLIVATVIGWMVFVVNNLILDLLFVFDPAPTRDFIVNLIRPFPEERWTVILIAVMHAFQSGSWIFPVIFVTVMSRVIQAQFLQFKSCLSKQIEEADGCIPDRLPDLRCRYTQLCQTIEILNDTSKWILGISFFLNISMACFLSYLLINNSPEISTIIINLFWLSSALAVVVILTISCSRVNDAAHSLLEVIFRIGTKNATPEQLGQLNLFVVKLTGTTIGFTAVDFFVITKEFLLTLGSLYITYLFVLLQFKIS